MRADLVEALCCPVCLAHPFDIAIARGTSGNIETGKLKCRECSGEYPIEEGVPIILPGFGQDEEHAIRALKDAVQVRKERRLWPDFIANLWSSDEILRNHIRIRTANQEFHNCEAMEYEKRQARVSHLDFNQKRLVNLFRAMVEGLPEGWFIDLGCGTGNLLRIEQSQDRRVLGIDISWEMLRIARQRGFDVLMGDISFLPLTPMLAAFVSIFSVLHHLYDFNSVLGEAYRILKEKGKLYTDWDPNMRLTPERKGIRWLMFRLIRKAFSPFTTAAIRSLFDEHTCDFLENYSPDLKQLYDLAEYRNRGTEVDRGINSHEMTRLLRTFGFQDAIVSFHWNGRTTMELPVSMRVMFNLMKSLGYGPEYYMENLMVVASK